MDYFYFEFYCFSWSISAVDSDDDGTRVAGGFFKGFSGYGDDGILGVVEGGDWWELIVGLADFFCLSICFVDDSGIGFEFSDGLSDEYFGVSFVDDAVAESSEGSVSREFDNGVADSFWEHDHSS